MSNANTVAQARQEFIADLKRIKGNASAVTDEIEEQGRRLLEKAQKRRAIAAKAAQDTLNANTTLVAEMNAAVDAALIAEGE